MTLFIDNPAVEQVLTMRECMDALDKAVNQGWGDKDWVEHDSDLDSVRAEPRFQTLLQAM